MSNDAVALIGSPKEAHAASLTYAEAANRSSKIKTSSYYPQVRAANSAPTFNGSAETKRKLRHSSQFSGSPQLDREGQSYREVAHRTQSYRDFAAGGHFVADKDLAALTEREDAEARGKQLDEENFAALFTDPGDSILVEKTEKMTLVQKMSDGRGVWKGVWKGPPSSPSKKEEVSLLDS